MPDKMILLPCRSLFFLDFLDEQRRILKVGEAIFLLKCGGVFFDFFLKTLLPVDLVGKF